jgi:hypothetical protein
MSGFLKLLLAAALAAAPMAALAQPAPVATAPAAPDLEALIAGATHELSFTGGELSGPGAAFLNQATARSQFVLIGESHFDHDTPQFAQALFHMLQREHGFDHLVVEQDGVGIEDALAPGVRGDPQAIANLARRYPTLLGFASDQDLELLADVGARTKGPHPIWGVEQAQGAVRYLEELDRLAPTPAVRALIAPLLAEARRDDARATLGKFLAEDRTTLSHLQAVQAAFKAEPGSRADTLLTALVKSAEIYSYYVRAVSGEPTGLLNNTVRESWLKAGFVQRYRAEASSDRPLKAMFKFGGEHMFRGLDPVSAFPIGNFAHEFAIANGMEAYGVLVVPTGTYAKLGDYPAYERLLLPKGEPTRPVVVDLRSLRNYQRFFRAKVAVEDQWLFRALINGYDAIVILPNSRRATFERTGFPWIKGN